MIWASTTPLHVALPQTPQHRFALLAALQAFSVLPAWSVLLARFGFPAEAWSVLLARFGFPAELQ